MWRLLWWSWGGLQIVLGYSKNNGYLQTCIVAPVAGKNWLLLLSQEDFPPTAIALQFVPLRPYTSLFSIAESSLGGIQNSSYQFRPLVRFGPLERSGIKMYSWCLGISLNQYILDIRNLNLCASWSFPLTCFVPPLCREWCATSGSLLRDENVPCSPIINL